MVTSCAHNETWITLFSHNIPFFYARSNREKVSLQALFRLHWHYYSFFTETEALKKTNVNFEVPSFISIEDLF